MTKPNPSKLDFYLIAVLLLSLGVTAYVQKEALFNPLAINDDLRNQIYWMARIVDPALYPNDLIASYFTQNSLVSPLVWLLYWISSHFLDPVRTSQLLPLLLAPLSTFFVYRFGENYAGKRYGFLAAFSFNMIVWLGRNLAGGLARAFAYPLLFAFLFFLSRNKRWGIVLTSWAASLIYPPILFLNAGIWLVHFLTNLLRQKNAALSTSETQNIPKSDPVSFLLGIGGGLAILIYRFVINPINPAFGALTNKHIAALTPEFYKGGRVPIFHYFSAPITLHGPQALMAELIARLPALSRLLPLVGILISYGLYRRWVAPRLGQLKLPPLTWQVIAAAVGLYILAWLTLFYLYVPERYLQLSIPVLYTFLLSGLLDVIFQCIQNSRATVRLKKGFQGCLLIALVALFSQVWDENLMTPTPSLLPIFSYLKHTPKNTVVATTPGLASDIPLYARRSVFLSEEGYIPFHQAYFQTMKIRLKDFLTAYYSRTPAPLLQFIQRYQIDYLIVNTEDYSPKRTLWLWKKYYHSFPKQFYQQLVQGVQPQDFLLSHPRPECIAIKSDHFLLIPTSKLMTGQCFETELKAQKPTTAHQDQ